MTAMENRASQILPTVKCSNCGMPVEFRKLGEHVCSAAPPMPTMPAIHKKTISNESDMFASIFKKLKEPYPDNTRSARSRTPPRPAIRMPDSPGSPTTPSPASASFPDSPVSTASSATSMQSSSKLPFLEKYRAMATGPLTKASLGIQPHSRAQSAEPPTERLAPAPRMTRRPSADARMEDYHAHSASKLPRELKPSASYDEGYKSQSSRGPSPVRSRHQPPLSPKDEQEELADDDFRISAYVPRRTSPERRKDIRRSPVRNRKESSLLRRPSDAGLDRADSNASQSSQSTQSTQSTQSSSSSRSLQPSREVRHKHGGNGGGSRNNEAFDSLMQDLMSEMTPSPGRNDASSDRTASPEDRRVGRDRRDRVRDRSPPKPKSRSPVRDFSPDSSRGRIATREPAYEHLAARKNSRSNRICAGCTESIENKYISALRDYYHPQCLECHHCHSSIGDSSFAEKGSRVYCRKDYAKLFLPKCRACSRPIESKAVSSSDGKLDGKWHAECFGCTECNRPFPDKTFYVYDHSPYCKRHYHELNDSVCKRCDFEIEGPCAQVDEATRFHPHCFSCAKCREPLDEYYEFENRYWCDEHIHDAQRRKEKQGGKYKRAEKRRTIFKNIK